MKGLMIFIASVFLLIGRLNAQSIFEDALFLKKSYQNNDEKKFELTNASRRFIVYYFGVADSSIVNACLGNNPFLKHIFTIGDIQSISNDKSSLRPSPFLSGNISNFAFGLTDFLIERTKTELYTAFFRKFKEDFSDAEELEDLRNLLPNTSANVALIGDNIYQFDLYMNSFRTAFEKDLRSLPVNTAQLVKKHPDFFKKDIFLDLGLDLTVWIAESRHPGEILGLLSESPHLDSLPENGLKNWVQATRVAALFSEALRKSGDNESYWVSGDELKELNDELTLKIFLGLLYQKSLLDAEKAGRIEFSGGNLPKTTFDELLKKIGDSWDKSPDKNAMKNLILDFATRLDHIDSRVRKIKDVQGTMGFKDASAKDRNKLMFDLSYDVFSSFLDALEFTANMKGIPGLENLTIDTDNSIRKIRQAGEIAVHISNKQYAGAVVQTALFLEDYIDANASDNVNLQRFLKYGMFMAALIEAESPEQAKDAIASIALPPGSYSIKRYSKGYVSLNGYLGAFVGSEFIKGVDSTGINNFSITAPVGIYAGIGDLGKRRNPWSIGLFVPILDLGTLASFRFGGEELETLPEVKLSHIVAPGLFAEIGIAGTPLSFGLGAQIGPRLREIKTMEENEIEDWYWRLGASLKVDIPLLSLHASPARDKGKK